ncbi:sporulation protein YqfD [Sporosarcina sp. FSL K6-1522]|uniref:sporulation protein YqfD n=1 Tax=Sporosarcina sp. FSL K6-1522 TaxID=2921554 RepID=UPI00315A12DF
MVHKQFDIRISGNGDLSGFLTKLMTTGTKITSLSVVKDVAHFRTNRQGVAQIRRHRRAYRLKAAITIAGYETGAKRIFSSYRFLIACAIPFVCSFFLWTVEVESEMPEVVDRIEAKLASAAIVPFRPLASIPDEGEIRRALMLDDPSLSWVRFRKVGATLTVIPMLSPPFDDNPVVKEAPADLIARTGGIITRFELERGERVGRVHQTVKKGDVLATGILEQGDKKTVVGAEGAVYADYWMEYSFSLPKTIDYQLQGEEVVKFSLMPPWQQGDGALSDKEERWKPWLPFVKTERLVEERSGQLELKKGMEKTFIIPLLKTKILSEPSRKVIIKDEKILHVTFDNDKVNGTVLFLLNDDIAVKRPISQGDEANWTNN